MVLSIAFLLTDVAVSAAHVSTSSGINPYWRFALVFKCASDTIFLDDFKSVLDHIVARKFSSGNDAVHRGSIAGSGGSGRKRSRSASRGGEFIECSSLEHPFDTPVHTSASSQSTAPKSKFLLPFSKERRTEVPKINIQPDSTVASQARQPSHDSGASDNPILPRPAHTVYGNDGLRANESDGDLMIGRLV